MPENVNKCPFSQSGCRNCPVYRGRHSYIMPKDGDETPQPRILKKAEIDWQERFEEALHNKEEDVPDVEEALRSNPQGANIADPSRPKEIQDQSCGPRQGNRGEKGLHRFGSKYLGLGNRQKVRSIGPWHIYSFERLLSVLAHKAESGCEEVELIEAPFYMGC